MSKPASILFIAVSVHIPHAHSLKEKRKHIKSLKDRLQSGFNASVAEIDSLEEWQRSVLGLVMISNDSQHLQSEASRIETFLLDFRDIQLISIEQEWL
jgi:uncharacterized protein YlxP (DUF503 family)